MQHQQVSEHSFLHKIHDCLLFLRPASGNEISRLSSGRQRDIFGRDLSGDQDTLYGVVQRSELVDLYGLERYFDFNQRSFEFVIRDELFSSFAMFVRNSSTENPQITIKQLLALQWKPGREKIIRSAGRPKAWRDETTGKVSGVSRYAAQVIELWEKGDDIDSIRLSLHPKTRTPTQKSVEIGKIKRNLRRYKYLLTRPYGTK